MRLVKITHFRLCSIRFDPFFILHANRTIAQIARRMVLLPAQWLGVPISVHRNAHESIEVHLRHGCGRKLGRVE